MMTRHRAVARPFSSFGRRARTAVPDTEQRETDDLADDLRLFALTFAGGFLFMSVYLA